MAPAPTVQATVAKARRILMLFQGSADGSLLQLDIEVHRPCKAQRLETVCGSELAMANIRRPYAHT